MVIKMVESEAAPEFQFVEIAEGVNTELDAKGEIIGIEIFNVSQIEDL